MIDVDFIVVDGAGLLEYSRNEYQEPLKTLCDYAEKHQISVVFNAIGRAGEFESDDFRCKVLKSVFQSPAVKYVSARDSVEVVQKCVGDRFNVKLCADAAFWMDRAFQVEKVSSASIVGIGLIRGDALQSYNQNYSESDWVELFAGIATELTKRNKEFRLFTNGMVSDYELGKKVLERLSVSEEYLIERPTDVNQLIDTIRSFEGLITCRMHSSIAAFTMGIPSVVLSWNSKVNKYMDIIGYHSRAIDVKDFTPKFVVDAYETAVHEGIDTLQQNKMKKLARESVEDYKELLLKF